MNAYTEENFNKLLEAYTEVKKRSQDISNSYVLLALELMEKHNYTQDEMIRIVNSMEID